MDVLLQDQPSELKRIQEKRVFLKKFESEPIDDKHKTVRAFGKNVNINAVLKLNIDKWNEFTIDNICDTHSSWKIAQLLKYQKKKRGIDFNWLWLIILIFAGIGGLIFIMLFILPGLGGVI